MVDGRPAMAGPAVLPELRDGGVRVPKIDWSAAPGAHKRLPEGLAHHSDAIQILNTLRPIGAAMTGAYEVDLYKDRGKTEERPTTDEYRR
ncbi:MAG: hypothetical protein NTZ50_13125 [Chloroflexi bacterium]|nr:hypothetical protein [Chloroflexota bacterium]